jgi:DUF4097 and DUF4098 domain-containing protein YvlB
MPIFTTEEPISVTLELILADVRINASDRLDTVVEIRPTGTGEADLRAAEETVVEYADGKLLVQTPKPRRRLFGRAENHDGGIQVSIEVPSGSSLQGHTGMGYLRTAGPLGACRFKTAAGDIELDRTGALNIDTAVGVVTAQQVSGDAEITTAHGTVRIGLIQGAAAIKNLSGPTELGTVSGKLRLTGVSGDISVTRAEGDVEVKTANGNLRFGEVVRGSVVLEVAAGSIDVGVRTGTAAWLDAQSLVGHVTNAVDDSDGSGGTGEKVKVHARTRFGSIDVHRS